MDKIFYVRKNEIYIIIVSFNGLGFLEKCLQSCGDYNVIVVDNNSTDATCSFIETHYPNVILLKQYENLGFGQGNNLGIRYALEHGAEHVFLLNQDAYLIGDSLEVLRGFQIKHPEFGILSPFHYKPCMKLLDEKFSLYLKKNNIASQTFENANYSFCEIPFVNAAAWLVSKSCIETVGGFDPLFFHYGEDENYCQRVIYHDLKIGVLKNASIVHDRTFLISKDKPYYTKAYYKKKLIKYKVRFANVNDPKALVNLKEYLIKLMKHCIIHLIKFKFRAFKLTFFSLRDLYLSKKAIVKSYHNNKLKGPNYLNLF